MWVTALCVLALLLVPGVARASAVPGPASGREVMMVANAEGGTVSVIDARSLVVLREIDVLPDGPDAALGQDDPLHALLGQRVIELAGGANYAQDQDISPDGRALYVSRGHRGDVAAFDLATGTVRWKTSIPGFRADHMTISRDGARLYVSALTENLVVVLDASSGERVAAVRTGQWPHDNHLSEDGTRLFNATIGAVVAPEETRAALTPAPYRVTVLRTSDLSAERTFTFDRGVRPIVLADHERRMYAQLSEFHGIVEVDLATGKIARQVELPIDRGVSEADYDFEAPHHGLTISHDERTLCAAGRASDYVALVSTATMAPTAIVEVDDAPGWAATSPDGRYCFAANNRADTISVISYGEKREVARIKGGDGPKQIEPARIPEAVICVAPGVPGCSRDVRLTRRCRGRRLHIALTGDTAGVRAVTFRAGSRRLARLTTPPFGHVAGAARGRTLRADVEFEDSRVSLARTMPSCRARRPASRAGRTGRG